jgi:hypothetical protein
MGPQLGKAAHSLGIALDIVEADESNLDSALAALAVRGAQGLIVTSDGVYVAQGKALAEGAIKYRFPAIFVFRDQVQAGIAIRDVEPPTGSVRCRALPVPARTSLGFPPRMRSASRRSAKKVGQVELKRRPEMRKKRGPSETRPRRDSPKEIFL